MSEIELSGDAGRAHAHEEGILENIITGLKSMPHLPDAIIKGVDDPSATEEIRALRRRALAEAAMFAITPLVGGGAGLLMRGMARPLIRTVIGDAFGGAAGGAAHATIMQQDPMGAALLGGLFGGGLGAVHGLGAEGAAAAKAVAGEAPIPLPKGVTHTAGDAIPEPSIASALAPEPTQLNLALEIAGVTPSGQLLEGIESRTLKRLRRQRGRTQTGQNIEVLPDENSPYSPTQKLRASTEAGGEALTMRTVLRRGKEVTLPILEDVQGVIHGAFSPARTWLQSMGESGGKLAGLMDEAYDSWRAKAAPEMASVRDVLKGMSKKEKLAVVDVMEGRALPSEGKIATAADKLRAVYDQFADEAEALGIRELSPNGVQGFTNRAFYFTRYYDQRAIKRLLTDGTPEFERAVKELMETAQAGTRQEAKALLNRWKKTPSEFRTGPINFARTSIFDKLPYEKDPGKVLARYIFQVRKRLEFAKKFGPKWEGLEPFLEGIGIEGGEVGGRNMRAAKGVFDAAVEALPNDYGALVKATTTWNTVTMLSTSGLVQPAQLANVPVVTSYKALIKGIGSAIHKEGREWAERTGAIINETMADMTGGTSSAAEWHVKAIGLSAMDKMNRIIAAWAGRHHAEDVASRFVTARGAKQAGLAEQLTKLGLEPAQVLAQAGQLTAEQRAMAARTVSLNTQFAGSVLDLPAFRNSAHGRIIYQFKPYALQQTKFLQREVLAPMWAYARSGGKKGSMAPMLKYSSAIGPGGAVIGETIRTIKGHPAPDDPVWKQIEGMAMAGGFGMFYDTFRAMNGGPGALLQFVGGPTAGEAANLLARDIPAAIKGDPDKLARHIVSRVPLVGQTLSNYWLFPRE